MKAPTTELRRLEALLQEELAAQQRTTELVALLEQSLRGRDPDLVRARTGELEAELGRGVPRALRRQEILRALAATWGVAPGSLTLSSIAERADTEGELILRLRSELRSRAAGIVRASRRLAALAKLHQRFFGDVLDTLLARFSGEGERNTGALIDAEA